MTDSVGVVQRWEVDTTLIEAWIDGLNTEEYEHLVAALEYLEQHGPTAGRPFVDTLEGSKYPNMKELRPRPTTSGAYMRVLFAFDTTSRAIMLVAGDKAGNWSKWYRKTIPAADALLTEHHNRTRQHPHAPKTRKGKQR